MKKCLLIPVIMIIVFIISACDEVDEVRVPGRFNSINFEEFEDTFNAMFDYEWTLVSVEEIDGWEWTHTEWTIEYRDGNNEIKHLVLDNRFTVCTLVLRYLRDMADYYKECFLDVYIDGADIRVSGHVVRADEKCGCPESREWLIATGGFWRGLSTPEGAVNLSRMTPANIFELVPYFLSITIVFDEIYGLEQQAVEESVIARIEDMIETMNYFSNNRLNARISVGYCRWNPTQVWNYIQGERVAIEPWADNSHYREHWSSPFEFAVFESYRGVFW